MMVLYHGTDMTSALSIIYDGIDLTKSKPRLDFGNGFYLGDDYAAAKKWATRFPNIVGVVLAYSMSFEGLKIKIFDSASKEWGEEVFANRFNHKTKSSDIDCIIGPIADGRMQFLLQKVDDKRMSKQQFIEAITPMIPSVQYVMKTTKAVQNLKLLRKDVLA